MSGSGNKICMFRAWQYVLYNLFFILIGYSFLLFTSVSFADEYHYNNIIIGDRASGMGGAYTAISDDPSGLYYNPAGIAFSFGRSLSGGAQAYHMVQKEYKDVLGGRGWNRRSSEVLPNYFGIILPFGNGKMGFSFAVPDAILEDQAQTFYNIQQGIERYIININDSDKTYNFGPSYGIKINERLALGTTLYMHYRTRNYINRHFINFDDGRYQWANAYKWLTESGLKPVFGLMWTPADRWSIGTTFSKIYIFDTDLRAQATYKGPDYTNTTIDYSIWKSHDKKEFPFVTTLGIAYFPSDRILFSTDISYYTSAPYTLRLNNIDAGSYIPENVSQESVVNMAIGAEYYPNAGIALRGGLYTNMANTPELISGKTYQPEHIDMYGASLSVSSFSRLSSLTVGGNYAYGKGKAQIIGDDPSIQDAVMQNLTVFVSATFSY